MATVRTKSFTYRIVPSVTYSGEPIYKLYRDWAIAIPLAGLVGGSVLLAQNKDRSVLERAIDHLEQKNVKRFLGMAEETTMTRSEQNRILARAAAYILILALIGLHATMAQAQTVTAEANVTWTLPTTDTLGQPLTGDRALRKVQLYVSTSPITDDTTVTPIDLPPGATTYVYEQAVPNGSTLYFRLRACNQICSELSEDTPQSRKQIRVSVPNVPTGVTVTLKVNLAITEP